MPNSNVVEQSPFSAFSLRRVTTSGSYIPEIDGLRFIAILSVLLAHVPVQIALRSTEEIDGNPLWHLVSHGSRGVLLFFVISGFILGLPFGAHLLMGKKAVGLRDYFVRRVTRLEPPYILSILIRLPLLLLVMHRQASEVQAHALANIFYLHNLVFGPLGSVDMPAWSLEVEVQFYCLAPLLAWAYFRLRPAWLRRVLGLAFIVAAGVLQVHFIGDAPDGRIRLTILNFMQYFFAGFLLCDLYLTDWDRIRKHWAWDAISMGAWLWIFTADGDITHEFLPVAALIAYMGAFKGLFLPKFFRLTWVSLTGGMCYSIYLTHNIAVAGVAHVFHRLFSSSDAANWIKVTVAYAATAPIVFGAGLLMYIAVERPCMDRNWPAKLWRHWRRDRTGESPAVGVPEIARMVAGELAGSTEVN
jgi:peptidoglycan/LPS O-acetylase OafA/YrhL